MDALVRLTVRWSGYIVLCALAACGGGTRNAAPVASEARVDAVEDVAYSGVLSAVDADRDPLKFLIVSPPVSGALELEESTGAFRYVGNADFHGEDSFRFVAMDSKGARSTPSTVIIVVAPVNDSPRIAEIADTANSAESLEVIVPLAVVDIEGNQVSVAVDVEDPEIVDATVDTDGRVLRLLPGARGETEIKVRASDGELTSIESFIFRVEPVTKWRTFSVAEPGSSTIQITNTLGRGVQFRLKHNSAVLAGSMEELLEEALAAPDSTSSSVAQRLWAYVNNRTYHWYSLTSARWIHDPLIMLNSVGFGLCDDVASSLALLARAANLQADVWALEGHVVAEIGSGDSRVAYDPDLSVYYHRRDGAPASVDALADDPSLITAPFDAVLETARSGVAYSDQIAAIYASRADNQIYSWYTAASPPLSAELSLPAGAKATYPGTWAQAPTYSGAEGTAAPVYANLMITLPAGWTGALQMPLVLKGIRGSGRVRVGTGEYEVSDPVLGVSLDVSPNWIPSIEVLRSDSEIELVFLLNPLRFGMAESTQIGLTSVDAWALDATVLPLQAANSVDYDSFQAVRKPIAR